MVCIIIATESREWKISNLFFQSITGGDFLPDVYSYPFECSLSAGFPSSVESSYGNIRYYVSVVLLNSSWSDRTYKKEFTLIKPLDLNLHEFLRVS